MKAKVLNEIGMTYALKSLIERQFYPEQMNRFSIQSAFGIIFFVAGVYMLIKAYNFVTHSTKTYGVVISIGTRNDQDGVQSYPIFSFTDTSGKTHTQPSSTGSSPCFFRPGQHVTVLYDPAVPTRAEIDSFQTIWFFPFVFMAAGGYFIYLDYKSNRKERLNLRSIRH